MGLPALVLVHGGGMAADSWGLVVERSIGWHRT